MQQFSIRVPEEMYLWLKEKAERESRSLNGQVNHLLWQLMEQEKQNDLSTNERGGGKQV